MYAYIKGKLEEKSSNYVVVEANDIGYKIFMSVAAITNLPENGEKVKIYTHYHVREDDISLYGFLSNEELKMFELLLGVSGVGAKSAISILSNITPSSFALAVISDDVAKLKSLPGIGLKSAQRIILELKDKLKSEQAVDSGKENTGVKEITSTQASLEATDALMILGYNKKEIEKVLSKLDKENMSTEDIIRKALSMLNSL